MRPIVGIFSRLDCLSSIPTTTKKSTSGEVRTHALKRGPELESGALTTRPQMLLLDPKKRFDTDEI